jgi:ABC-type multidrug transport system permease subunit
MFALTMFAMIVMVVLLPCLDFRNRFFKDQGYLTHTLPVKTSTLIGARLICDLVMIAWMAAVYGLAVCVATGLDAVYAQCETLIVVSNEVFSGGMSGMTVDRSLIVLDGVLALLMMWLGVMCNIWTINAAYAFGHAFTKWERIWSVVFFALIQMICGILVVVFNEILSKQDIDLFLEQISSTAKQYLIVLVTVTIIEVVGIAVLSVATTLTCKHKLNLE